jgi:fucokinase
VLAHCDVGILATVGAGCLLHDIDLANGADVPPGVFLHCVPLRPEAEEGMRGGGGAVFFGSPKNAPEEPEGGEGRRAAAPAEGRGGTRRRRRTPSRRGGGAGAWTCIVLDVRDEVKKANASTLCGVPVAEAARRLGLDPSAGAAV